MCGAKEATAALMATKVNMESDTMITLLTGQRARCCDGIPRRSFVKAGFLGLAGLSMPQMLRIRAQAASAGKPLASTSVIFINLQGGPTQFETYDPKPEAPADYRGAFGSIPTRLPGVHFCELMPQQAKIADKMAIIRSVHQMGNSHYASLHLAQTGYPGDRFQENRMPSVGSIAARLRGANARGIPPYVSIIKQSFGPFGRAAYLGNSYDPLQIDNPSQPDAQVKNLALLEELTTSRLSDRRDLLGKLDAARRLVDQGGVGEAMDEFGHRAFEMVTGNRARDAFDVSKEDPAVRESYGDNRIGQGMLLARRLVEAGVTFVTVCVDGWDDHGKIAERMAGRGPRYDRAMAALVSDLYARGLDREVLVVSMGEFGRTPRINKRAGRDHWGALMSAALAGGGLRMGQVVGASDPKGQAPTRAPYRPESVLAMVYRHLGIDPAQTFDDHTGRPHHILSHRKLIHELI